MTDLNGSVRSALARQRDVDWSEQRNRRVELALLRRANRSVRWAANPKSRPVAMAMAACLLGLLPLAHLWHGSRSAVHAVSAQVTQAPNAARASSSELALPDGSHARLATPASRVTLQRHSQTELRLSLTGEARFEVVLNPARRFIVSVGQVSVEVLGTVFTVTERSDGRVRVAVERGRVGVSWSEHQLFLTAGSDGVFPPLAPAADDSAAAATAALVARESWQNLARAGAMTSAWDALSQAGAPAVRDLPEELLLAADVARQSGHPGEAVAHLNRVITRHSADPRASVAAFTLGRVEGSLGHAGRAAAAFERCVRLAPRGALVQEAYARGIEAWRSSGQSEAASRLAREFVSAFPDSAQAKRLAGAR